MVWRVVEHDARRWHVTVAAERRANSAEWNLVFSFRSVDPEQRTLWVTYPLSSAFRTDSRNMGRSPGMNCALISIDVLSA